MTIDWHLDTELAQRYADGEVGTVLAASVEQHIVACARCQALLVPAVDSVRIDRVWAEVLERVEAPRISLFERSLRRLGVSDDTARLIALTPSLRGGWLSGVALVLTLALFVSRSGPHGIAFFLAVAPLLPMLGVALAFGPHTDPAYDIVEASPYDSFRLLAVRALTVVSTTLVIGLAAALLLPGQPWLAVGWLLPALALAVLTVAAARRIQPLHTAAALTVLWLLVSLPGLTRHHDPLLAANPTVQLASLLALAIGAAVLIRSQHSLQATIRRIS